MLMPAGPEVPAFVEGHIWTAPGSQGAWRALERFGSRVLCMLREDGVHMWGHGMGVNCGRGEGAGLEDVHPLSLPARTGQPTGSARVVCLTARRKTGDRRGFKGALHICKLVGRSYQVQKSFRLRLLQRIECFSESADTADIVEIVFQLRGLAGSESHVAFEIPDAAQRLEFITTLYTFCMCVCGCGVCGGGLGGRRRGMTFRGWGAWGA